MQAVFTPFLRYFEFSGRSSRLEYWLFSVMVTFVSVFLLFGFFGEMMQHRGVTGIGGAAKNYLTLFIFWIIATCIPHFAVTVRRLHDRNMSGWFFLVNLVPYVGGLIVFVILCLDGTKGPNNYGPDPKGRSDYWWETDGIPPESRREIAKATGGEYHIPTPVAQSGGFGRRGAGFGTASPGENLA